MKTAKRITVSVFLALIICTLVLSIAGAIESHNYDIKNNVDIFEGLGAVFCLLIGGFAVLCEIDLFYTVFYFLFKSKTIAKTVLNLLSGLSLVFLVTYCYLIDAYMELRKYESPALVIILFSAYVIFRFVYVVICGYQWVKED